MTWYCSSRCLNLHLPLFKNVIFIAFQFHQHVTVQVFSASVTTAQNSYEKRIKTVPTISYLRSIEYLIFWTADHQSAKDLNSHSHLDLFLISINVILMLENNSERSQANSVHRSTHVPFNLFKHRRKIYSFVDTAIFCLIECSKIISNCSSMRLDDSVRGWNDKSHSAAIPIHLS